MTAPWRKPLDVIQVAGPADADPESEVLRFFDGTMFKQPYSASFRLIRRTLRQAAEVAGSEFAIPVSPGDVVLKGEATNDPISDVLGTVLRELGRLKGD